MSTEKITSVLLVEDSPADAEWVMDCLDQAGEAYRIEHASRLSEAAARLAASQPDVVLLDLMLPDSAGWNTFSELRQRAPRSALVVLSGMGDEALARQAVREGAQDYLIKGRTPPEILIRSLHYALERQRSLIRLKESLKPKGRLVVFIGAKGGVGATTVAANVAAALSRRLSVIVAELESLGCGLAGMFRIRSQSDAWAVDPQEPELVTRRLWKLPSGLRVLPGPRASADQEIPAGRAEAVVEALLGSAERVIVDLAPRTSAAGTAVLRRAERIVVVLEREPASVAAACRLLEYMREACRLGGLVEAVVVNRVALSCPLPLEEIQRELGIPVLGVIPPNPDLCLQAQRAGVPIVFFQPESALGASLLDLADKLEQEALVTAERA
jgi:Flp pilus assembly CpaE family ATPase